MSVGEEEIELTIVIVSFRCRDLLADCLESLEAERGQVSMEVLLYDNDSDDGTVELVRDRFDWVNLTALDENIGFGRANNLGFAVARGKAILALNPDMIVPAGALRACLDRLWEDPTIGLLTPRLIDPDGRLDRRCKRGFPTIWSSICYFTGLDRYLRDRWSTRYTMGGLGEHEEGEVESVSGAFMLMSRSAYVRVGGFDERFFMYAEDMDLSLRISEAGFRVLYWPGVDIVHVGAGSSVDGVRPPMADAAYFRTMAPFTRKHRPGLVGLVLSVVVWVVAEAMYLLSRLRAQVRGRAGRAA